MKKYSKKWMQTFVEGKFPENNSEIIEKISKHAFEVEDIESTPDGDSLFEIKVLPNRVSDAFCLEGMAQEWAAVFVLKFKDNAIPSFDLNKIDLKENILKVEILKDGVNPINNFFAAKIKLDQKTPTPQWVKEIIEKSGGRLISPIVDFTNLIIFTFGQPCHAFDASKLSGNIQIRFAKEGEKLTVLGGKELKLRDTDIVVADDVHALDLAGVKGGVIAEVDENTQEIIYIVPNFNGTLVRSASMYHGIRTDASKLFENHVSPFKTESIFKKALATLVDVFPQAQIEWYFKVNDPKEANPLLEIKYSEVSKVAGIEIPKEKVKDALLRLRFNILSETDESISVQGASDRLDLNIKEDVYEEVMRIYGFDNIPSVPLKVENNYFTHNKRFLLENFLKKYLSENGFTEIYNYTFVERGDLKVLLPLAEDKSYLRNNLIEGGLQAYQKNYNYLPMMESEVVKFFEIGSVFLNDREDRRMLICLEDGKKKSKNLELLESLIKDLEVKLNTKIDILDKNEKPALVEFSLDDVLKALPEGEGWEGIKYQQFDKEIKDIKYKPISIYPFIVRDIAMWVPGGFDFENLKQEILKLNLGNVEKIYMFDSFTKKDEDGNEKSSVAFRIIFQSYTETLTDEKVEVEMQKVYAYLKANNFEIR